MANKKSFRADESPVNQLISQGRPPVEGIVPAPAPIDPPPPGYRIDPRYIETRTRRLHVLIPPSVFKRLQRSAFRENESVNEAINALIVEGLARREAAYNEQPAADPV